MSIPATHSFRARVPRVWCCFAVLNLIATAASAASITFTGHGNSHTASGQIHFELAEHDGEVSSTLDLGSDQTFGFYTHWEADWDEAARNGWVGFTFTDPVIPGYTVVSRDGPDWAEISGLGGILGEPASGTAAPTESGALTAVSPYGSRLFIYHFTSQIDWSWDGANLRGDGSWRYWLTDMDGNPVPDSTGTLSLAAGLLVFAYLAARKPHRRNGR